MFTVIHFTDCMSISHFVSHLLLHILIIRVVPKLQSSVFLEQMLLQSLRNFEICSKIFEEWSKKNYLKKPYKILTYQINHPKSFSNLKKV